jgi:hypothetical protein
MLSVLRSDDRGPVLRLAIDGHGHGVRQCDRAGDGRWPVLDELYACMDATHLSAGFRRGAVSGFVLA